MTFIELFKNYWALNRNDQMPAACATVYFYLLQECNMRRWIDNFSVSMRSLMLTLGMSRDSIYTAREILKKRGLIDFQKGQGSASARYTILGVKDSKKKFVSAEATQNPTQTEIVSAGATQTPTQTPTQNPTQTENTPINIFKDKKTIKDIKTTTPIVPLDGDIGASVVDVEDHKKFFVRLRETPTGGESMALQREGISEEDVEVYGREVIDDWIAEGVTHNDERERLRHFMRRLKIKRNIAKQQQEKSKYNGNSNYRDDYYRRKWNDYHNRRGVDADAKKEKDWDARF